MGVNLAGPDSRPFSSMTDEDRALLTAGSGPWTTVAIPRRGVPAIKMTDGVVGARGNSFHRTTSACFPCGPALAASWNSDLIRRVGHALGTEAMTKNARILLAPVLNLHRHPLSGRNFESFSEDPVLVARMGVAYIRGVQDCGVAAVAKHFVANDSEFDRERIDAQVDERTLREVYLRPFEDAVKHGGVWAVMSAYNRLNGVYCSENAWLIRQVLRSEWGFDGVVLSDWGGTHSTQALIAGLDLEMPGPGRHLGPHLLGHLSDSMRAALAASASRMLTLLDRTRAAEVNLDRPEQSINVDEHRAIARRAAQEGIVLLTNNGILPLAADTIRTVAVIGPAARSTPIQGGGSAAVNPHYSIDILTGISEALGPDVRVLYEPGVTVARYAPLMDASTLSTPDQRPGMLVEYRDRHTGDIISSEILTTSSLLSIGPPAGNSLGGLRITARAQYTPTTSGRHRLGLISAGHAVVTLDGWPVLDSFEASPDGVSFFGRGTMELLVERTLTAGRGYELAVELEPFSEKSETAGFLLGAHVPAVANAQERAVDAARDADIAIVVAATGPEWESEGGDRQTLTLPGAQDELIRRIATVNSRTVVVLACGAAVATPWTDQVAATMVAWFGGQEVGHAVADILLGTVEPTGRLPVTFPANDDQLPDLGLDGSVITYRERDAFGYRRFERDGMTPAFPFGHGLTYTTFDHSDMEFAQNGEALTVSLMVRNSGLRPGVELIQLFARELGPVPELRRLVDFARCPLRPNEERQVAMRLDWSRLRRWDCRRSAWTIPAEPIELTVKTSGGELTTAQPITLSLDPPRGTAVDLGFGC